MALKRNTAVYGIFAKTHMAADPHEELDHWRSRADVLLRAKTAPSMQENFAQIDKDFKAKYGVAHGDNLAV